VYAPYGRTGIYMLQEFCRRLCIPATDAGIRDVLAALRKLPQGHPLERLLQAAPDFRDEAALADALLHPQDRAYSISQLFDFLEDGGLRFSRWVRQAPYSPQCGIVAQLPHASHLSALSQVDQYSAVELFRGTMIRHSVVARHFDRGDSDANDVNFADDGCLDYVPIRIPDTICVRVRLPPGAAAVLINPTHTYTDLVLPIDALELQMFEAIDGTRCIGDISNDEHGRRFFERLWHHDHIVVDATSAKRGGH